MFNSEPVPQKPAIACPECGSWLRLKRGHKGLFFGCQEYPRCTCTCDADQDGEQKGQPLTRALREARTYFYECSNHIRPNPRQGEPLGLSIQERNRFWRWLAAQLGIEGYKQNCTINTMSASQLQQAAEICKKSTKKDVADWNEKFTSTQFNKSAARGRRAGANNNDAINAFLLS